MVVKKFTCLEHQMLLASFKRQPIEYRPAVQTVHYKQEVVQFALCTLWVSTNHITSYLVLAVMHVLSRAKSIPHCTCVVQFKIKLTRTLNCLHSHIGLYCFQASLNKTSTLLFATIFMLDALCDMSNTVKFQLQNNQSHGY